MVESARSARVLRIERHHEQAPYRSVYRRMFFGNELRKEALAHRSAQSTDTRDHGSAQTATGDRPGDHPDQLVDYERLVDVRDREAVGERARTRIAGDEDGRNAARDQLGDQR